jgi:hypothetical protein
MKKGEVSRLSSGQLSEFASNVVHQFLTQFDSGAGTSGKTAETLTETGENHRFSSPSFGTRLGQHIRRAAYNQVFLTLVKHLVAILPLS